MKLPITICVNLLIIVSLYAAANTVSLPFHTEFDVIVTSVGFEKSQLTELVLSYEENPDVGEREIVIGRDQLTGFVAFMPLNKGDRLRIRESIFTDANSNTTAHYEALEKYPVIQHSLSFTQYGDLNFGQSIVGMDDQLNSYPYYEGPCYYAKAINYPDIDVMVDEKILARVDFRYFDKAVIGTPFESLYNKSKTFDQWRSLFPNIEISPHEYVEGYYLTYWNTGRTHAMLAEYSEGNITAFRVGIASHVTLIEGCS